MFNRDTFKNWRWNPGASVHDMRNAVSSLGRALPSDYLKFLSEQDGGEGFVGGNYLILWRVGEIERFNREYEVDKYAPGLILFASDGGGEAYAFDTRDESMQIVSVPFIGMDLNDVSQIAPSFTELISQLAK